jgi:hypothetical protein
MGNLTSKQTVQLNQDDDAAMNQRKHMGATCHAGSAPIQHPAVANKCGDYAAQVPLDTRRLHLCKVDIPARPKSLRGSCKSDR